MLDKQLHKYIQHLFRPVDYSLNKLLKLVNRGSKVMQMNFFLHLAVTTTSITEIVCVIKFDQVTAVNTWKCKV